MGSMGNTNYGRLVAGTAGYSWFVGSMAEAVHKRCLRHKAAVAECSCLLPKAVAVVGLLNRRRCHRKEAEEVRCNCMERWAGICNRPAKETRRRATEGSKKTTGLEETEWRKTLAAEGTRQRAEAAAAEERDQYKG